MSRLTSTSDLDRLRDQQQQARRDLAATTTLIRVGMGTCGIAAGARETMAAIREELARHRLEAVISIVGCIGICVREPLVDIQQAGRPRVVYANVSPEMVPHIIAEHLLKGRPVKEWVIGRMTWE